MTQRAVPMLSYEDVAAAADWLGTAFGFRERGPRFTDGEGRVTQVEMELDGASVMLGWPGEQYRSPGTTRPPAPTPPVGSTFRGWSTASTSP